MSKPQERQILAVVREHVRARGWPDPGDMPHVITEGGTFWRVTFDLPEGVLGGVPIVDVDKKTLQVISSCHTQ
jgi:hypothetical protein